MSFQKPPDQDLELGCVVFLPQNRHILITSPTISLWGRTGTNKTPHMEAGGKVKDIIN